MSKLNLENLVSASSDIERTNAVSIDIVCSQKIKEITQQTEREVKCLAIGSYL
jgi:hypothetical protein